MLIKLPKDCIERKFSELLIGDLTLIGTGVVMKIRPVSWGTRTEILNSVNMSSGNLSFILSDVLVNVVSGELTVSYATVVDLGELAHA